MEKKINEEGEEEDMDNFGISRHKKYNNLP